MSMKKWFLQLFKIVRNEERIGVLEDKFKVLNKDREIANQSIQRLLNSSEFVNKRLDVLKKALDDTLVSLDKDFKRIGVLEGALNGHNIDHIAKSQLDFIENQYAEINESAKKMTPAVMDIKEKLATELEDLKYRLGKAELMHAATSKKQNELFGDAMTQMIDMSGKLSIHITDLAEKRIKEVTASMDPPDPDEFILILMNGKPKKVRLGTITHADILDIYFYPYLERKKSTPCSIIYENGGDEDKPFGTISENEKLVVKPGTIVNVTVL